MKRRCDLILRHLPDLVGRDVLKRWGVPKGLRRVFMFWQVSASAWLLDVAVLMLLLEMGVPVFMAACLAYFPAVLLSFTLSTYKIYFREKGFSRRKFALYVSYNATMMLAMGWVVATGIEAGVMPVLMKVSVTPVTFFANYFFMRGLLKKK